MCFWFDLFSSRKISTVVYKSWKKNYLKLSTESIKRSEILRSIALTIYAPLIYTAPPTSQVMDMHASKNIMHRAV
jgi:hypothetical protein